MFPELSAAEEHVYPLGDWSFKLKDGNALGKDGTTNHDKTTNPKHNLLVRTA